MYSSLVEQPLPSPSIHPNSPSLDTNPLRMLRSGAFPVVRPRVRGNKHNNGNQPQQQHQPSDPLPSATTSSRNLPRLRVPPPPLTAPPPIPTEAPCSFISAPMPLSKNLSTKVVNSDPKDCSAIEEVSDTNGGHHLSTIGTSKNHQNIHESSVSSEVSEDIGVTGVDNAGEEEGEIMEGNPIPLPPRDRSRPLPPTKPRHQRKHPLIIPGGGITRTLAKMTDTETGVTAIEEVTQQYLGLQTEPKIMLEASEEDTSDKAKSPPRTSR